MPNYNYVIDSSFRPFSLQEMLVPFNAYKEAYDKQEAELDALSEKLGDFDYLKEYADDSKVRKIYESYADEYNKQLADFSSRGLHAGNRRALTALKRRFSGEIGRLKKAEEALKEEQKLRRSMNAQDASRLYAEDNLDLDQFLDNRSPNLYSISGNELYAKGAAASKAASARIFNTEEGASILNGYYIDYVQKNGYSKEAIESFINDMASIPELQRAVDDILEGTGVNQNLTGVNLDMARKNVIRGIIDGAVYSEQHSPQRDLNKMTAHESADLNLKNKSYNFEVQKYRNNLETSGYPTDENGNIIGDYDSNKDVAVQRAFASGEIVTDKDGNIISNTSRNVKKEEPEVEKMKASIVITKTEQWKDVKKVSAGNDPDSYGTKKDYDDFTKEQKAVIDKYHKGYMKSGGYDFYEDEDGNITIIKAKESVPKKPDSTPTTPNNKEAINEETDQL